MKNLIKKHTIEDLEILPIELLSLKIRSEHRREFYKYHKGRYDSVGEVNPWKLADYIIEDHIGKPFNDAYSKFCKKTKWYQKSYFKENFVEFSDLRVANWRYYCIDENGLIQRAKSQNKYKGPYPFRSDDYKTELVHRITGHKKSDFKEVYEQIPYEYNYGRRFGHIYKSKGIKNGKLLYYEYGGEKFGFNVKPLHERYKAQESDFEPIIVSGWIKYFKSKHDPEFIRLISERLKYKSKTSKQLRKEKLQKDYSYISKDEIAKEKEKEINHYKILAHGFDPVTSFRTERQTNPDLIKEKQ